MDPRGEPLRRFLVERPRDAHPAVLAGSLPPEVVEEAAREAAKVRGEDVVIGPRTLPELLEPAPGTEDFRPAALAGTLRHLGRSARRRGRSCMVAVWVEPLLESLGAPRIVEVERSSELQVDGVVRVCLYSAKAEAALADAPFFSAMGAHRAVFLPRDEGGRTLVVRLAPGRWLRPWRPGDAPLGARPRN